MVELIVMYQIRIYNVKFVFFNLAEKKTAIGVVQGNIDEAGELVCFTHVLCIHYC